jgi:purine-nucleoside phosphorylase
VPTCEVKPKANNLFTLYNNKIFIYFKMSELQKIQEAVNFINQQFTNNPQVGIVLGSGLGNFAESLQVDKAIPYADIPHFPQSTVEGHSGKLIFGTVDNKPVVCMAGRFHYYEGYNMQEVVFPIRVMKYLGISTLVISNAAGGTNSHWKVGDIMIIKDHISFFTINPLLGKNVEAFGPRFPDMSEPFKKEYIQRIKTIAANNNIALREGVYCGVTGPTFETRSEYQLIKNLGGDAVGMSTVAEVIAAAHMGLPVLGISVITDIGIREEENTITHDEVLQAAKEAEPKMSLLITEFIKGL